MKAQPRTPAQETDGVRLMQAEIIRWRTQYPGFFTQPTQNTIFVVNTKHRPGLFPEANGDRQCRQFFIRKYSYRTLRSQRYWNQLLTVDAFKERAISSAKFVCLRKKTLDKQV